MKQSAAIILALGSSLAHAQSTVNIYGIVDAAFVGERGGSGGNINKITSGAAAASRIGFRGEESLGEDLSAYFNLETGARIDTGEVDAAGTIFNRVALLGLRSKAGAIALGRQYTPYYTTLVNVVDPFRVGYAGTAKNLFPGWGTNIRTSNTITYASPRLHGMDLELAYSAGEQASIKTGRQFGGALGYSHGPLTLRLAYNSKNTDSAGSATAPAVSRSVGRNTLLGANYDFGVARLFLGYGIDKGDNSTPLGNANNPYGGVRPTPSTDGRDMLAGFTAPLGAGKLMFSVMRKDDRTAFDQDAIQWGIGYQYFLSNRTLLYTSFASIRNRNGAGYTVGNGGESGSGNRGFNMGVRLTF